VTPTKTPKPTVRVTPTNSPTPTVEITPTIVPTKVPSTYYIDSTYKMIRGVAPKTTALRFKLNASKLDIGEFTIYDLSGNAVSDMNVYVGTGFKVKTASGTTYKIIVTGDGDGDGLAD
ncbi:MAG: hypothetical protein IJO48_00110, partial [Clostridia bacterium]|nr:hypothetical protein [Clostridia bacterium]